MRMALLTLVVSAGLFATSRAARSDDSGQYAAASNDASSSDDAGTQPPTTPAVPIACDGALCDTTSNATCGIAAGSAGDGRTGGTWLWAAVAALATWATGRRRRR